MIGIASEVIKRKCRLPFDWNNAGRLSDEEYKRIKIILAVTLAACLMNPMFLKGAWYPISVFFSLSGENKIFFKYIQELQNPITAQTLFDINHYRYYKVLVFVSAISFVFNRRNIDISALIFWLMFLLFSLIAVRNTPFFAFAAYLVIITNTIHLKYEDVFPVRFSDEKFKYLTAIVLKLLLLVWLIGFFQLLTAKKYYDFEEHRYKSVYGGISKTSYPHRAADFVANNDISGNFFNDFNSGAYLIGRTYPDIKVFIDGRTEVYGGEFFNMYRQIWEKGDPEVFQQAEAKYGLTGAFLSGATQHIPKKLLNYLYNRNDWVLVYFDYDAVVFLKDLEQNKELISRYRVDLNQWQTRAMDAGRIGPERVQPYHPYYRAYTFESLKLFDQALSELNEALRIDPFYAKAHDLKGKIFAQQNRHKEAFEHFRVAVMIMPKEFELRSNLARSYFDLGNTEEAIRQYLKLIAQHPMNPRGHYLIAQTYVEAGRFSDGLSALETAFSLDRKSAKDLARIGDGMFDQKAYAEAHAAYSLGQSRDDGMLYKKMGMTSLKLNKPDRARAELQKAQSFLPDDDEIEALLNGL